MTELQEILPSELARYSSPKSVQSTVLGFQRRRINGTNTTSLATDGQQVINFTLNGPEFIDPSSVYLHYDLVSTVNNAHANGQVVNMSWPCMIPFESSIQRSKGTEISRISRRLGELKHLLMKTSTETSVQTKLLKNYVGLDETQASASIATDTPTANTARPVLWHQVLNGVFTAKEFLNLDKFPLELEYTMKSLSQIQTFASATGVTNAADGSVTIVALNNIYLSANYVEVDPSFSQAFQAFLRKTTGGEQASFSLHLGNYHINEATLAAGENNISLPMVVSDLRYVMCLVHKNAVQGAAPAIFKSVGTNYTGHQITANSKYYPSYRTTSRQEAYFLMQETWNHTRHWIGTQTDVEYRDTMFVICQDFERSPGLIRSGIPVNNSLQLSVTFSVDPVATMISFGQYETIVQIYDSGVVMTK